MGELYNMASYLVRVGNTLRVAPHSLRYYSQDGRRPTFISRVLDNLRQEMAKNKEMKENLIKFREEAQKLENTEALKKAREKFQAVESEAAKSSDVLKGGVNVLKEKVQGVLDEAQKTEFVKKAGQLSEGIGKTAKEASETIAETGQKLKNTASYKTLSDTAEAVKKEIDMAGAQVYRRPVTLRKRKEFSEEDDAAVKPVEINTDAQDVVLHKDSKFYESWQNFKNKNPYVNQVLNWKSKYEESDNVVLRASRALTDKVVDIMGGLFQKTELSEALTEICKMDPNFNKEEFLKQCEHDIIPNILESMVVGDLEILKDWCHEAPYNVLATPIKQALALGCRMDCRVLDVDNVDLVMGKVMEQGHVLIISFTAQQIMCVRDAADKVVEGDPDKILRVNYIWVLCRDQTELDPSAAWRLMDLSAHSSEQFI